MGSYKIRKGNIKLTLSIDERILKEYKKICSEEGLVISKQIENFMKKQIKKR